MSAPDDSAKERILAALRAYHGGKIYLMGSPGLVAAGFELHNENEVASIEWSKNFSCLHVRIGQAGRVVVNARLKEDQPVFSCTCSRGSRDLGCEHAVCAVLTLKNLLIPDVFKPKEPDPVYRRTLLAGLVGASPDTIKKAGPGGLAVLLEQQERGGLDVYVARNGERITKLAELLQTPLTDFAAPDLFVHQKLDALRRFLKLHGNKYPIIVRTGEEEIPAIFDPAVSLESFTEFALTHLDVAVVKGLRDQDKQPVQFVLFGALVYLQQSKKLTLINSDGAWEAWRMLNRGANAAVPDKDGYEAGQSLSFSLSQDAFNALHYAREKSGKDRGVVLYTKDGKKAEPVRAAFEHRLTIGLPEEGATAVLLPECVHGSFSAPIEYRSFDIFEEENGGFRLQPRGGHQAAVEMLAQDGEWRSVGRDQEREAFLLKVACEVLGREIYEALEQGGRMRIPAGLLFDRLTVLYERLTAHGIGLYLKGKPVKQGHYAFAIDAAQKTGIDWFEVRPEIRCNGALMDNISVKALFDGRGVLEKDDCIQILDSNQHRVFARIAAAYRVAEGPAKNGRDLVHVPRLRILDWAALRTSGVAVRLSPEDEEIVEQLLQFERIEKKRLPGKLRAKLRPYQQQGYSWLAFLYEHRLGACLADDMGLGKTVQAISFLGGISEGLVRLPDSAENFPHLIVVPPSLVFNWEQEIQKFYPGLKVHVYTGSERSDDFDQAGVVVSTYGTVRRDIELLKDRQFHVIIFDEAQAVKNLYADTTGAVRQLKGIFKLVMTGTPVENHLGEYFSVVDLAVPGLLGEYDRFRPLVKNGASADLDVIMRRTRPFVLRRTKEAVLTDLPSKSEMDIYLDLSEEQKALYQKTVEQVRTTIDDAYGKKTQAQARIIALTAILKLRQICITPQLIDPGLSGVSPKMDFLIERLHELLDENHSALVFSQFTSFLDILGDSLKESGIGYFRLDGSTPMLKRKTLVTEFQSGKGPSVFLLSLKAGGQGLNLTQASYVFHLDPWWNPAVENQASDRAHRIGQRNKVTITRLLMRHSIEEKMTELKKRKRALFEAIVNDKEKAKPGVEITRGDFDFLLGQSF